MNTNYETADLSAREIEEAVVCLLLTCPETLPEVAGWLTPEMFHSPQVGFIMQAIRNQYDRGETPDFLTTETEMQRINLPQYEQQNGIAVLNQSLHRIRHAGNLARYAAEIQRRHLLRLLQATLVQMGEESALVSSDPVELMNRIDARMLQLRETALTQSPLRLLHEVAGEVISQHRDRSEKKTSEHTVLTGFEDLDSIFGGHQPGEIICICRPAGRWENSHQPANSHERSPAKQTGLFFSPEMDSMQVINRLLAGQTGVNAHQLRLSHLKESDFHILEQQQETWKTWPLYFDFTPNIRVEDIRANVLLQKKKEGCDLVIIDHLHQLGGIPQRGETADQVVGRKVQVLKKLALEAGCAVLLVSQMNRQSENRREKNYRPQLSDLRDSGVIEQMADGVIFVYCPDRHGITQDPDTGESLEGFCQLIIRKNRNGVTGTVNLKHNDTFTQFRN